jgi:hypothetical protein
MKYVLVLSLLASFILATDDVDLYKKLNNEVTKKDTVIHKGGDVKVVVVKSTKDTKLTKNIKKLLKKENIAKVTKKYEDILKD